MRIVKFGVKSMWVWKMSRMSRMSMCENEMKMRMKEDTNEYEMKGSSISVFEIWEW